MSKTRADAYKKGPLLIKIEPCPRTAKAEPCTEECTKECLEKPYTIFDPKPPRKSRKSLETPQPPLVKVIEPPRSSVDSSSSSHADSAKSGNSGHVLNSPGPSLVASLERYILQSIHAHASVPEIIPLVLPEVKESKDEEGSSSIKESEPSVEESRSPIKERNSPINESEVYSKKSETSSKKSVISFKNSEIFENESIESNASEKYHPSSKEPSVNETLQPEKQQNVGCVLEVLILERHDKKCKSWRPPDGTVDWLKEYNIVSHHAVPICQGHPSPELCLPLPRIPFRCICEKSTNVNKFSSCPVCSRCPCHGRQIKTGYVSTTESEPLPPSEPLSFSDLSEPDTFIESGSSRSFRYDYIPDFKNMPIVKQPLPPKKYPFFVKCFVKNKKKSVDKADETPKDIVDSRCPQCPEPLCLNDYKLEKSGE